MSDRKFDFGKVMIGGIIVLFFVLFLMVSAHAAPGDEYADLTWVAPTESLTGERNALGQCITVPIPTTGPDSLAGFRIVYNTSIEALNLSPPDTTCSKTTYPDPTGTVINITDPLATSARIQPAVSGTYYFMIGAVTVGGEVSYFTGPASKVVTALPVSYGFSTYETPVYNVVKKNDGFVMVVVGAVPLNTLCIKAQTINGYYAVPVAKVTSWTGTVRPIVVVAKCKDQ